VIETLMKKFVVVVGCVGSLFLYTEATGHKVIRDMLHTEQTRSLAFENLYILVTQKRTIVFISSSVPLSHSHFPFLL
jgi:hypothetical protein